MPVERQHESEDLEDYTVLEPSDTLDDELEEPLDRGVAPPERWSAGVRYGTTDEEQFEGESLDQHLAEEEPDVGLDDAYDEDEDDEDKIDYVDAPRSGRLVAESEGIGPEAEPDLVARDAGVDGGAASAEESAVHTLDEDDV
jgi:Family of unknown function (DUF5709)